MFWALKRLSRRGKMREVVELTETEMQGIENVEFKRVDELVGFSDRQKEKAKRLEQKLIVEGFLDKSVETLPGTELNFYLYTSYVIRKRIDKEIAETIRTLEGEWKNLAPTYIGELRRAFEIAARKFNERFKFKREEPSGLQEAEIEKLLKEKPDARKYPANGSYDVGQLIIHKIMYAEWGLGRVCEVTGDTMTVEFEKVGTKKLVCDLHNYNANRSRSGQRAYGKF